MRALRVAVPLSIAACRSREEPARVELAREVGATPDSKVVNVEIGRYRWDPDTRRFKAQGKPRHAMRPMQMGPFPPK